MQLLSELLLEYYAYISVVLMLYISCSYALSPTSKILEVHKLNKRALFGGLCNWLRNLGRDFMVFSGLVHCILTRFANIGQYPMFDIFDIIK